jgi:hypothetical protein
MQQATDYSASAAGQQLRPQLQLQPAQLAAGSAVKNASLSTALQSRQHSAGSAVKPKPGAAEPAWAAGLLRLRLGPAKQVKAAATQSTHAPPKRSTLVAFIILLNCIFR